MKLKHLLPIATIASVATIVTPLVTSCSHGGWDYTWDFKEKGEFEFKIEQATGNPMTNADATNKYFADVSKNHKILAEDLMTYRNEEYISYEESEGVNIIEFIAKSKTVSVNEKAHTLSFDSMYSYNVSQEPQNSDRSMAELMELSVRNLKFELHGCERGELSYYGWQLESPCSELDDYEEMIAELNKQGSWSIKTSHFWRVSGEEVTEDYEFNNTKSPQTDEEIDFFENFFGSEFLRSHYLDKINYLEG